MRTWIGVVWVPYNIIYQSRWESALGLLLSFADYRLGCKNEHFIPFKLELNEDTAIALMQFTA